MKVVDHIDWKNSTTRRGVIATYEGEIFTGIVKNRQITCYFKNGLYHREDGPARIYPPHTGKEDEYFLFDKLYYSLEDYKKGLQEHGITRSLDYFKNLL